MSSLNAPSTTPAWFTWVAVLLIVGVTGWAYSNATKGPFIFDDHLAIVTNPNIRSLTPIREALFSPGNTGIAGRPITALSFALNYAYAQLDPAPYHAVNIGLHVLTAVVGFVVLRRILARIGYADGPYVALIAALIWAVHPLQTEAVTYIVNRSEVLMALFALLTVYTFLRAVDSPRPRVWLAVSVVCNLAAVSSKEVGAMIPPLVYLLDVVLVGRSWSAPIRRRWGYYAALLLVWVLLAGLLTTVTMIAKVGGVSEHITPWGNLLMQSQIIVMYLKLCFWPAPLIITYVGWPVPTFLQALPYSLAIVLLLAATVWLLVRRHPAGLIGACLFLVLAPSSSILPLPSEPAAERRMYLPLLAIAAGVVTLVAWGLRRIKAPNLVGTVATVLLVFALCQMTLWRNDDYSSAVAIWTDTVNKLPGSALARFELGGVLQDEGRIEEALACYDQAIALEPTHAAPYINRAGILASHGQVEQALRDLDLILSRTPDNLDAAVLRAHILVRTGRRDEAIPILQDALRRRPNDYKAKVALDEAMGHANP